MTCSPMGGCGASPAFQNLIWVNASAPNGGSGSVDAPFNTMTAAVAAAPTGKSSTLMIAPGDYSGEPALSIADKDLAFWGLGGSLTGALSPPARPIIGDVTFAASAALLVFYARNCELGLCTVNDSVDATLEDVTSSWVDAGALSLVRASGSPTPFNLTPQESISGSVGNATLQGMLISAGLSATDIVCYDCLSTSGGGGLVATDSIVLKNHEFGAAAIVNATNAIFLDQWSWFQAQELAAVLSLPPRVQELSPNVYLFGASNLNNAEFLNPNIVFATTAANANSDYHATPRPEAAAKLSVQLASAHGNDVTLELYVGATPGTVAATGFTVTVLAGNLQATATAVPPIAIPQGRYKALRFTSGSNIAGIATWGTLLCS